MPVAYFRREKTSNLSWRFCFRVTYLPGQANVLLWRRNSPVDCYSHNYHNYIEIKKPQPYWLRLVFALPIFPGSHPPSIVGVHVLNFCVRDGNRWTLTTINTNSQRMAFNHPLYKPLSRLFMVTHTGFEPMLTA